MDRSLPSGLRRLLLLLPAVLLLPNTMDPANCGGTIGRCGGRGGAQGSLLYAAAAASPALSPPWTPACQAVVAVPDHVEQVPVSALQGCQALTTLRLGNATKVVEEQAFADCPNLTRVAFAADSVLEEIGPGAFENCVSLRTLDLPDSLQTLGFDALAGTALLENNTRIPPAVTALGNWFGRCPAAHAISFNIPSRFTSIAGFAFSMCDQLVSVNLHENITAVGFSAFADAKRLREVTLSRKLMTIGASAFDGCVQLLTIRWPEGVRVIEDGTFRGCIRLGEVWIPPSVTAIAANAFDGCSNERLSCQPLCPGAKANPVKGPKGCKRAVVFSNNTACSALPSPSPSDGGGGDGTSTTIVLIACGLGAACVLVCLFCCRAQEKAKQRAAVRRAGSAMATVFLEDPGGEQRLVFE